jgi:hypothetical protein
MFELREELEELDLSKKDQVGKFRHLLESTQQELKMKLSHYFKINDLKNASQDAIRLKYYTKVSLFMIKS